ncbi:MAG: protein kinase [Thermoflexales bacterium]|nr:protein kinase [Thermoflexales bacterium]
MPLQAAQVLHNRYRIERQLGQGGMGAVYLAHDTVLEHKLAVKEMRPAPGIDEALLNGLREQFQREARVLAGLNHPNLPRVTDYFTESNNAYLVMDYIEGQSLDDVLKTQGQPGLPEAQVVNWARQLLDALEYIHNKNVLHRDIKPANIRLTPDGRVVLVDFGLVKLYDPSQPQTVIVLRGAGTPQYAPPEQIDYSYGHTDARSDLFSLGATLYCLLTGKLPPPLTERLIKQVPIPPIWAQVSSISPTTEAVIFKAIQLRLDERFQSAAEMRAALTHAGEGQVPAPTVAQQPPPTHVATPQPSRPPTPQSQLTPQPSRPPTPPPTARTLPPAASPARERRRIPAWGWFLGGCGCMIALSCAAFLGLGAYGASFTPTPDVAVPTAVIEEVDTPLPPIQIPTPAPTQPPVSGILYSDDFSDPASGWDNERDDESSAAGYADGSYFLEVRKDKFIIWENPDLVFGNIAIQVDTEVVAGDKDTDYGIICRYQDSKHFYLFMVMAGGEAAIRKQEDGDFSVISHNGEWLVSDIINPGLASNNLGAVCDGDHLALYVNGFLLLEATDGSFAEGDVGLAAGTFGAAGVRVEFDNLVVTEP